VPHQGSPHTGFNAGNFFLEETPRAAFFNAIRPFGTSPNRKRFFESQFDPFFSRFSGQLGQEAQRTGQFPTGTFQDFLGQQDFGRAFQEASPFQQGASFFNPRARWLLGF